MSKEWDVAVVGAGPVGLAAAGEVARDGARVVVLERRDEPSRLSRAFGVHARTLELLDQRGLADDLLSTGRLVPHLLLPGADVRLDGLPSRFAGVLVTPQTHVDAALERWALDQGAVLRRGCEVVGLQDDGDGVRLDVQEAPSLQRTEVRARWVVGADGAHSAVRDLVGSPFPGETVVRSLTLADARLATRLTDGLAIGASDVGFAFVAPFGDGWYRVIAWDRHDQLPDDAPVDLERLARTVTGAMGRDLGISEVRWSSRFHSDERQVPQYRIGQVLLAGDAAHVHSPAGGQGMNTGIQDAINVGWKLRAVIGGADPDVVRTYHDERHPVGRTVLRTSGAGLRFVTSGGLRRRLLGGLVTGVLLRVPGLARGVAATVSGIGVGYGHRRGEHRTVGSRAPDVPLVGGGGLHGALRGGRFVLVLERGAPTPKVPAGLDVVERSDAGPAVLVRPDGYVAWAGGEAASGAWRAPLRRWGGSDGAASRSAGRRPGG